MQSAEIFFTILLVVHCRTFFASTMRGAKEREYKMEFSQRFVDARRVCRRCVSVICICIVFACRTLPDRMVLFR